MPNIPQALPSRVSKRNDTWEPVTGVLTDVNGPVDLTGATLRFLAKADIDGIETIIDSDQPTHGTCDNVEDLDGAGPDISMEWPPQSGIFITVPQNRGRFRFNQSEAAVSAVGLYACEIEAMKAGKTLTFPNREVANPVWQIDRDIA
jgi:hypothetical protein